MFFTELCCFSIWVLDNGRKCFQGGRRKERWPVESIEIVWNSRIYIIRAHYVCQSVARWHYQTNTRRSNILTHYLLNDLQFCAVPDEHLFIPRVNTVCCLLQQDAGTSARQVPQINDSDGLKSDAGSEDEPDYSPYDESVERKPLMPRNDSFGELLILHRIVSMPQFLFNIQEDAEGGYL